MLKHILNLILLLVTLNQMNIVSAQQKPIIYQTFVREAPGVDNSGQIIMLDALDFKPIDRIVTTPFQPESIVITSDQKLAFLINDPIINKKKGIFVIDLATKNTIKTIFEGTSIYGIKLAPNGIVWVLLDETQEIAFINPKDLSSFQKIKLEGSPRNVVFSPDSKDTRAYVSLVNSEVFVFDYIDKTSITAIRNLPKGDSSQLRPQELELSFDGKTLYIGSEDTISIADTTTKIPIRVTHSFPLPKTTFGDFLIKASYDGQFVYIAEYLGVNIYVYDVKNKTPNKMTVSRGQGIITNLNISSDGKILYISRFYGISLLDTQNNSFITTIVTSTGTVSSNPFSLGVALTGDFSIGQAPTLKVSSPSTGDNFVVNQNVNIQWQTTVAQQSYSLASHTVELSTDGGQTFNAIAGAEELLGTAQEFTWIVPNIEVINKAQIRVSTVDLGARRTSDSTGNFSILKMPAGDTQAPMVTFLSPRGNEEFVAGNNLQISWTSSDNVGVTSQDLSLSLDGGTTFPISIASGLTGTTQSFVFPIPETLSGSQARLRLVVKDGAGNTAQAITPANFTIKESADSTVPTVTISSPITNSSLIAGQSIQVNWQSADNRAVASQALLISFDAGQSFTTVANFGAADSSFVINNIDKLNFTTSQAVIKVTAKDSAGNVGQANTNFIIKPMISVASYQSKTLTINGIGFMSNTTSNSSNVQILINDKVVTVAPKTLENMSITIKGNKKKLNLLKGANNVQLMVDGVLSNQTAFQF